MNTIAHIINPFDVSIASDLYYAQPITMESMIRAKNNAIGIVNVKLYATKFIEDKIQIPTDFIETDNLNRSILDTNSFKKSIKLPFLIDIICNLYNSTEADYLIYTNVDIGLYPSFYMAVNDIINQGYDSFIINRRRISSKFKSVNDLDKIYLEKGRKHPGFDCFVFHRSIVPKLKLDGIVIGVPFIEISFSQNLFCLARNFRLFEDEQLTFHIGMEIFKRRAPKEYFYYNKRKFWALIHQLNPDMDKFPFSNYLFPIRIIKWALHPCIPIRLVLKLLLNKLQVK